MGVQELKAFIYRLNQKPYLYLRWFDSENYRQTHHVCVRDNQKEYFDFDHKDWPVQTNKHLGHRDEDYMINICFIQGGTNESMAAVPMAFVEQARQMELDHELVRERGFTIDLEEFKRMAHKRHNEGWFGAGRERLLMLLLGGALGGLILVGLGGSYFSAQAHIVNVCYSVVGHNQTQILCPVHTLTNSSSSSTHANIGGVPVP